MVQVANFSTPRTKASNDAVTLALSSLLWLAFAGLATALALQSPHMQLGMGWCLAGLNGNLLADSGRFLSLAVFVGHCPWCPAAMSGFVFAAIQAVRAVRLHMRTATHLA